MDTLPADTRVIVVVVVSLGLVVAAGLVGGWSAPTANAEDAGNGSVTAVTDTGAPAEKRASVRDRARPERFDVTFRGPGAITAGDEQTLVIEITPHQTVDNASARIQPPYGGTASPTRFSLGRLEADDTERIETSVVFDRGGNGYLHLTLTGRTGNGSIERRFARQIEASTGSAADSNGSSGAVVRPIGAADGAVLDSSSESAGNECSDVTVKGQGQYTAGGTQHPMRAVNVTVYDADRSTPDDELTTVVADDSGAFSACVAESDESGTVDPYVVVSATNPAGETTTGDRSTYRLQSATVANATAGTTVVFGSDVDGDGTKELVPESEAPAWQAVDWALDERRYLRDGTSDDWTRSSIRIEWPVGSSNLFRYQFNPQNGQVSDQWIELTDKETQDWDRGTVLHEYGHAAMMAAYENNASLYPDGGSYSSSHCPHSETDPQFALVEGWAEAMEGAVDDDPQAIQQLGGNIETNQWYNESQDTSCVDGDSGDMDGASVEGSVASVFFDAVDEGNANDESMTYEVGTILDPLRNDHPQTITEFDDYWSGDRQQLAATYTRYGIQTDVSGTTAGNAEGLRLDPSTVTNTSEPVTASADIATSGKDTVFAVDADADGSIQSSEVFVVATDGGNADEASSDGVVNLTFVPRNPGVDSTASVLVAGESGNGDENGTLDLSTPIDPDANATLTVVTQPNFSVTNASPDGVSVSSDATINATADAENTGGRAGQQTLEFRLDTDQDGTLEPGEELANNSTTLNAGDTTTVTFSGLSTSGLSNGTYTHGVFSDNDSDTATITIGQATQGPTQPVGNSNDAPKDGDGDGLYENVDGSGGQNPTILDVIALLQGYDSDPVINDNGAAFNFDGDPNDVVNILDVVALLEQVN